MSIFSYYQSLLSQIHIRGSDAEFFGIAARWMFDAAPLTEEGCNGIIITKHLSQRVRFSRKAVYTGQGYPPPSEVSFKRFSKNPTILFQNVPFQPQPIKKATRAPFPISGNADLRGSLQICESRNEPEILLFRHTTAQKAEKGSHLISDRLLPSHLSA